MARVTIRNNAVYARTYRAENGERITLRPGLNEVDEATVRRIAASDNRLARQLEEGDRPGSLKTGSANAFQKLVRGVENGDESINAITPADEAIKVVREITDTSLLEELYRQCNRVSVRNEITKRLRALGYIGTDIE